MDRGSYAKPCCSLCYLPRRVEVFENGDGGDDEETKSEERSVFSLRTTWTLLGGNLKFGGSKIRTSDGSLHCPKCLGNKASDANGAKFDFFLFRRTGIES
jgi:hypothetical protein